MLTLTLLEVLMRSPQASGLSAVLQPYERPGAQHPQPGRTLLIVQGAWRTLDRVVDSIIQNLVEANEPCDVILSLDSYRSEDTEAPIARLGARLVGVIYPSPDDYGYSGSGSEFSQVRRALRAVDTSRYEFVMKTRTDLFIARPYAFSTAAAQTPAFPGAFRAYLARARAADARLTPCGAVSQWLWSAGMDYYRPHARAALGESPPWMVWSPVSNADISARLLAATESACAAAWAGGDDAAGWRFLEDARKAQALVAALARAQRLLYMQGGTWMSWGFRQDFLAVHAAMHDAYASGAYSWLSVPAPLQALSRPDWVVATTSETPVGMVCESIFRLAHPLMGTSLVELRADSDFHPSFERQCYYHCLSATLLPRIKEPLGAFILREIPAYCRESLPTAAEAAEKLEKCWGK
jgi:hypothetical protein